MSPSVFMIVLFKVINMSYVRSVRSPPSKVRRPLPPVHRVRLTRRDVHLSRPNVDLAQFLPPPISPPPSRTPRSVSPPEGDIIERICSGLHMYGIGKGAAPCVPYTTDLGKRLLENFRPPRPPPLMSLTIPTPPAFQVPRLPSLMSLVISPPPGCSSRNPGEAQVGSQPLSSPTPPGPSQPNPHSGTLSPPLRSCLRTQDHASADLFPKTPKMVGFRLPPH